MPRRRLLPHRGIKRRPPVIEYNPIHRAICPWCGSLGTLYIPAIAEGHCDTCGRSWRFLADPDGEPFVHPKHKPKQIDYADLVGFCVAMLRTGVRRIDEAKDRYRKLNIAAVDPETWERAWADAKDRV
jgi:hypothetical protein